MVLIITIFEKVYFSLDTFTVDNYQINENGIAWKTDRETKFQ